MGKQVIVVLFVVLFVVGGVFTALSHKQHKAIDEIVDQKYVNQARHIANTFAHTGLSELRANLKDKLYYSTKELPAHDTTNVLNIVPSRAQIEVFADFYDGQPLPENHFAIVSTGTVSTPDGKATYVAQTKVIYSHALMNPVSDDPKSNSGEEQNLPTVDEPDNDGNYGIYSFNERRYIEFEGNNITLSIPPGSSFPNSSFTNQSDKNRINIPVDALVENESVIVVAEDIGIKGNLLAPVTIVCGGDMWICDSVTSSNNSTINLKAANRIIIAKGIKNLKINANLFTKGLLEHEHKSNQSPYTLNGSLYEKLEFLDITPNQIYSSKNNTNNVPTTPANPSAPTDPSNPAAPNTDYKPFLDVESIVSGIKLWEETPINIQRIN